MPVVTILEDRRALIDGALAGRVQPMQRDILTALHAARGAIISDWALYQVVRPGGQSEAEATTLRVAINRLRRILSDNVCERIHGQGYRLADGWSVVAERPETVMVRIPDDMLPALRRAAEAEGLTLEEMAIEAMREFLG